MTHRTIAHLHLDDFYVSVERLHNRGLKERPVMIGSDDQSTIIACSTEARKYGINKGMPISLARQLCPEMRLVKSDPQRYQRHATMVSELISQRRTPYERAGLKAFYLDLTGVAHFSECYRLTRALSQEIRRRAELPLSFGLAANKTVARIAATASKPHGQQLVVPGREKAFLAPLSIRVLPSLNEESYAALRGVGIEKLEQIQEQNIESMEDLLGYTGRELWRKANGICDQAITPYFECKSISSERIFAAQDDSSTQASDALITITDKLMGRLHKANKMTSSVIVKVRYPNHGNLRLQTDLPFTSSEHIIKERVQTLFRRLEQRDATPQMIGVKLDRLVDSSHQFHLFNDLEEISETYRTLDRIRQRFGKQAVAKATSMYERLNEINPFRAA